MDHSTYNPQEVLSPLLDQFGRTLPGERDETFRRMVDTVGENLEVSSARAEQLLETLESSGLIRYEEAPAPQPEEFLTWTGEPVAAELAEGARTPVGPGAWKIGPPKL